MSELGDRWAEICRAHFVEGVPVLTLVDRFFLARERIEENLRPLRVMLDEPAMRALLGEVEKLPRRWPLRPETKRMPKLSAWLAAIEDSGLALGDFGGMVLGGIFTVSVGEHLRVEVYAHWASVYDARVDRFENADTPGVLTELLRKLEPAPRPIHSNIPGPDVVFTREGVEKIRNLTRIVFDVSVGGADCYRVRGWFLGIDGKPDLRREAYVGEWTTREKAHAEKSRLEAETNLR